MQKLKSPPAWYRYDAAGVIKRMQSHESGLSAEEAQKRLVGLGPNTLPPRRRRCPLMCLLTAPICVLLLASVLTAVTEHWLDTGVILVVILLNLLANWLQQNATQSSPDLADGFPDRASVRREGNILQVDTRSLVPGDIIMLGAGDKVPADLRLIEAQNLRVDESMLTGEATAVAKQTAATEGERPAEVRSNMLFCGSTLVSGCATGIAVATGAKTQLGRIEAALCSVRPRRTPQLRSFDRLGNGFWLLMVTLIAFLFFYALLRHSLPMQGLMQTLAGLAVAAVPAGLPMIIVLALALSIWRLRKMNIAVRHLSTAETLGALSVVCCDKTHSLTMNEMTVRALILHEETIRVEGNGYQPTGRFLQDKDCSVIAPAVHARLRDLLRNMDLCSDSTLLKDEGKNWRITGEPTQAALKMAAAKAHLPERAALLLDKLPFDELRKYQATRHLVDGESYILALGEPEALLRICDFQQTGQGLEALDVAWWQQQIAHHAAEGLHLIASACRPADKTQAALCHDDLQNGLVFCGIAAMIDPPRPEAARAIADCQRAGIRVKMLADDPVATALAIGRMTGIGGSHSELTGRQLERMSDIELARVVDRYDIFVGMTPAHRQRLVAALQSQGEVVGITGNGAQDIPALKQADVGIATQAANGNATKAIADLVLPDNHFAALISAVQEGQRLRDGLKKAGRFMLPICLAQTLLFIAALLAGKFIPIAPLQVLWINVAASVTLAVSLISGKTASTPVCFRPREASRSAQGCRFWHLGFTGVTIMLSAFVTELWLQSRGYEPKFIHAVLLQTLIVAQWVWLLNCREPARSSLNTGLLKDYGFWLASALLALLQLALFGLPVMQSLFASVPLPQEIRLLTLAVGALLFAVFELEKMLTRRRQQSAIKQWHPAE